MKHAKRLIAAAALCAAVGGCRWSWVPKPVEAVDITSDYYHRAKIGLFRPDREPIVIQQLAGQTGIPEEPYFKVECGKAVVWVKTNEDEQLVLYVDEPLFYSHLAIACEAYTSRRFEEWPIHPVR